MSDRKSGLAQQISEIEPRESLSTATIMLWTCISFASDAMKHSKVSILR